MVVNRGYPFPMLPHLLCDTITGSYLTYIHCRQEIDECIYFAKNYQSVGLGFNKIYVLLGGRWFHLAVEVSSELNSKGSMVDKILHCVDMSWVSLVSKLCILR